MRARSESHGAALAAEAAGRLGTRREFQRPGVERCFREANLARDGNAAAAKCARCSTISRSICRARFARRWRRKPAAPRLRVGSSQPREGPATMFYTRQVDPRGSTCGRAGARACLGRSPDKSCNTIDPLFPVGSRRRSVGRSTHVEPAGQAALGNPESRRGLGSEVLAGGIVWRGCLGVGRTRNGGHGESWARRRIAGRTRCATRAAMRPVR